MPSVRDNAFCVRVWDWSETSQTVSLFAREYGLIRAVAKGSKREHSPYSGGLELMTRGEMMLNPKGADQLSLLTAWDLQECFPLARTSLGVFRVGMLALDLVQHAVHPFDPHPQLFDALAVTLRHLRPDELGARLAMFLWAVLSETGHRPELLRDVRTGQPLTDRSTPAYTFSARLGGLFDPTEPAAAAEPSQWQVRAETIDWLRGISVPTTAAVSPDAPVRAARLLAAYFREVFRVEPNSMRPALEHLAGGARSGSG